MKNKTIKTTWVISGIIILFIIMVVIVGGSGSNNYSSQTPKKINTNDIGDKIDLHVEAQQFVLQGLKAPATAKFPALPYEAIDLGNDRYKITSFVDSQNSFGAMLRSNWSVVFQYQNEKTYLEKMIINDEVVYQNKENKKQVAPSKSESANTKAQTTPPSVSKVVSIEQPKSNSTSDKVVLFGETVKLSDKNITVYSVGEYIAKYDTPREGYRFIYIDAEIENLTDEDIICMLFHLTDDKGKEYERGYIGLGSDPGDCIAVSPFKKARGYTIFEVPRTRAYFQVKYANVLGDIKVDPLHIIFKPNLGWELESRVQN